MTATSAGADSAAVAFPFSDDAFAALEAAAPGLVLRLTGELDQAAVDAVCGDGVDGLVALHLPSDPAVAAGLSWLQVPSAGVDHLLHPGPWPEHVTLTNARGAYAGAIAQFAIAAILRTAEPLADRADHQRRRHWPADTEPLYSRRLRGKTLVLVGYGGIGREFGRVGQALGLRVVAVKSDPDRRADDVFHLPGTGDPEGRIPERFVGVEGLAGVASEADYLVITLPMTERTRGLVSAEVIAALPDRAWIVNVGRGGVVEEAALIDRLVNGRLGGAILDVVEEEPLPADSPLWGLPNVEITPHVAGAGAGVELAALVAENLRRFASGEALLNVVDVGRGY